MINAEIARENINEIANLNELVQTDSEILNFLTQDLDQDMLAQVETGLEYSQNHYDR